MTLKKHINDLQRILDLIERKATGTPKQLAKKLGVSKRTVVRMIGELRDKDHKIEFQRNKMSYTFTDRDEDAENNKSHIDLSENEESVNGPIRNRLTNNVTRKVERVKEKIRL